MMAKARMKHNVVASVEGGASKTPSQAVTLDVDDVTRRAYDLYLARGRQAGHDVDDWIQAERELRDLEGSGIS